MSRNICVCQRFLTPAHKEQIRSVAEPLGFTPHFFDLTQKEEAKACLQDCEILYTGASDLVRAAPATLQWYCSPYAGVEIYCNDPTFFANPDCLLSNTNGYGYTLSEHAIMLTLMLLRHMPEAMGHTRKKQWNNNVFFTTVKDTDFTVLGSGSIGTLVAQRLKALGAPRVVGMSRSGRPNPAFDEMLPISKLEEVLPKTKCLIMALPNTPETANTMSRERLALLPKGAFLVNVGRGTTLDQEALMDALNSEALGGAAIDVAVPEPLPEDHPLWDAKNIIITPHIAGNLIEGHTSDVNVDMFCADLENYAAGRPLAQLVDRSRGY